MYKLLLKVLFLLVLMTFFCHFPIVAQSTYTMSAGTHTITTCSAVVYDNGGNMLGYMHSSKVVGLDEGTPDEGGDVVYGTQYDWLSTRYATASDLAGYDLGQLRVLRNSIYARHGRMFRDANLRSYFNSQPWYNGYRQEIPASELNQYEQYNIQFIQSRE